MESINKQKISKKIFNYFKSRTFRFVFALLWITLASVIDSLAQQNMNYHNSVSKEQNEENDISRPTVFGGVGRKFPTWQFGLDLILLSNPHYSANRNRLNWRTGCFGGSGGKVIFGALR